MNDEKLLPASPAGLEFHWAGGDVRSKDIGPADGDRLLGRIDQPGLYFFVGENTRGKSHLLRLLTKLQKERLLSTDGAITDGESSASLQFALARVTFRRLAGGAPLEPTREGVDTLPRIETLPTPIDALITGLGRKGDEERAKARLEALLTYVPIASNALLVRRLVGAVEGRLDAEPGTARRELWERLSAVAKERTKRLRLEPFRSTAEILSWLLEQDRVGILEDHAALVDILNATANVAEKLVEIQALAVAQADGGIEQVVTAAVRRLDRSNDSQLTGALRDRAGQPAPDQAALSALRERAAELRAGSSARKAEVSRREALRAQHGECPDRSPAADALDSATAQVTAAGGRKSEAVQALAVARQRAQDAIPRAAEARAEIFRRWERWRDAAGTVDALLFGDLFGPGQPPAADTLLSPSSIALMGAINAAETALEDLGQGFTAGRKDMAGAAALDGQITAAEEALMAANLDHGDYLGQQEQRRADLAAADKRVEEWGKITALLAETVPGPTDDEVEVAAAAVRAAEQDEQLWLAAQDYAAASLARDGEAENLGWLELVAAHLRRGVQESWKILGTLITEELGLPWLKVLNGRILIGYDGSGPGAALATTEPAEWRDLDDGERVSRAELHEAVLRVMLDKRQALGGILVIPDATLFPLDEDRLARFSGWARDAGIFAISERPRRAGDPRDLSLLYVAPPAEVANG